MRDGEGPGRVSHRPCRTAAFARAFLIISSIVLAWGTATARAHHRIDPAALLAGGIVIPKLTHGEMAVVQQFAPAIRDLAGASGATDPTFRRIANFAALQRTYCLWGLVPGSLADEESPFNECLHAYLAALRALLSHMQEMPERASRARALASEMDRQITGAASADLLCRNSGGAFSTAQVIVPDWRDIAGHRPTMLAILSLAFVVAAGCWTAVAAWRLPR